MFVCHGDGGVCFCGSTPIHIIFLLQLCPTYHSYFTSTQRAVLAFTTSKLTSHYRNKMIDKYL